MDKVDILVFLQNPWTRKRVYLGKPWDDQKWEAAMWESRSGLRLRQLFLGTGWKLRVRNCNPIPTPTVSGLRRPDPIYVREQVKLFEPKVLLLCGIQALKVGEMGLNIPFITMPHPAYRLLTNEKLRNVREHLVWALTSERETKAVAPEGQF